MAVSLADEAYLAIRDEILRGQLGPGTPLSRRRLARQLGMSVLPVSDALKRLEEDGLVETRARAGTRVKVPTKTDVRELYELREALETQSARLFAERATPVHRRELRRLAGHVDALFERHVPHAYLLYPGEDHGFRGKDAIIRSFGAELSFYAQVFGFEPADDIEPIAIQFLDAARQTA